MQTLFLATKIYVLLVSYHLSVVNCCQLCVCRVDSWRTPFIFCVMTSLNPIKPFNSCRANKCVRSANFSYAINLYCFFHFFSFTYLLTVVFIQLYSVGQLSVQNYLHSTTTSFYFEGLTLLVSVEFTFYLLKL